MTGIPTQTTLSGILLVTIGTLGDVLPFLVIGRHLQAKGLVVKVATHEHYRAQVEAHGLAFRPLTVEGDLRQFVTHTHAWNPERGVAAAVDKLILPNVIPVFELIENEAMGRDMLVLAHAHALGARVAQDRYDLRLWTLYPSAWLFQSVFAGQVYPRVKMTLVGDRGRQRLRYHVVDWALNKVCGKAEAAPRYVIAKRSAMWYRRLARRLFAGLSDAMLANPVNELRRRVSLPSVRGVLTSWCHSPQRTVGLFLSWYAEPQPDWPARCLLTGFIRGGSNVTLSEDLQAFLDKGSAPVVFTFGSEKTANRTRPNQAKRRKIWSKSRGCGKPATIVGPIRLPGYRSNRLPTTITIYTNRASAKDPPKLRCRLSHRPKVTIRFIPIQNHPQFRQCRDRDQPVAKVMTH